MAFTPNLFDEEPNVKTIPQSEPQEIPQNNTQEINFTPGLFDEPAPVKQSSVSENRYGEGIRIDVPTISKPPEPQNPIQAFKQSVSKFYRPDMTRMQLVDELSKEFQVPREELEKDSNLFDKMAKKKAQESGVATQPTNEEFMNSIMVGTLPIAGSIMGPLTLAKGLVGFTAAKGAGDYLALPAARAIWQGLNQQPIKYEVTKLRDLMPEGPLKNISDLAEFIIYGKMAHSLIGSPKVAGKFDLTGKYIPSKEATGLTAIAQKYGITEPRIAGELAGIRYRILKSLGVKQPTALVPLTETQIKEAFGESAHKYLSGKSREQWIREQKAQRSSSPTKVEYEKWRLRRLAEREQEQKYAPKVVAVAEQTPQTIATTEPLAPTQPPSKGGEIKPQTILKEPTQTSAIKPVKVSGEQRESRAFQRVQDRLTDARRMAYPGEEAEGVISQAEAKYNKMNIAEDTARALRLVSEQPELARKIAYGMEVPPSGVTDTAVSIAYSESMREAGNWKEMVNSEKSRSLRQTRRGQEIVAERGRANENSAEHFLMQVFKARLEKAGKSLMPNLTGKETKTLTTRATERISSGAKNLKKQVFDSKIEIDEAQKILDSLIC